MAEQNTLDWHRERLGYFTGSRMSDLMTRGKKKDETFGKTSLSYIYEVAGERLMNRRIVENDELFTRYLHLAHPSSSVMEWGHENEDLAAEIFRERTSLETFETESLRHQSIPYLSASPDRLYRTSDGQWGIIEIKCPMPKAFMQYKAEIRDSDTLKAAKPEYWWQMQTEMMCAGYDSGYFVAFCPFVKGSVHYVKISADTDAFKTIEERVTAANDIISNLK